MNAKRIVIKIGTNLLTEKEHGLNINQIKDIARQIAGLKKDKEIIIVTSGAIGAGSSALGLRQRVRDLKLKQALAAIGQSTVMRAYHNAFSKFKIKVAQILLTYEDFSNRTRYLNLRDSINTLLKIGVIPIINENDPISIDEIGITFGDNDRLSALVASKMNADLLIMLTDIDGLFDRNPKTHKDAKLIRKVTEITREIERTAGKSGSLFAVGGMITKIEAAKIAMDSGCDIIICNGRKRDILNNAINGKEGTLFIAKESLSNKKRWIKFSKAKGKIIVDKGAETALRNNKSLLSVGIKKVDGNFNKNDIIEISDFAKGITDYSSEQLNKIKGKKGSVVVKSENIIFI